MKPRLPIVLPPRASRARLPFLLVLVLAGTAALQLVLPQRIELPPGGSVARVRLAALPSAPPVVIAPPLLASRDLFAPPARRGGPDSAGDPLGGAVIAGVVQKGRLRLGVVQQAGGQVRYVAVGGEVSGWRLAALDHAEARLTQGLGQNLVVPYGSHPPPPKTPGAVVNSASPQTIESGQ